MLSFGQLIEEGHDVETCVLQQPEPQGCGRSGSQGERLPHSEPRLIPPHPLLPTCSAHVTHLLGSLSFFTFLLSLKYSAKLLLWGTREKGGSGQSGVAAARAGLSLLSNSGPGQVLEVTLTGQGSGG